MNFADMNFLAIAVAAVAAFAFGAAWYGVLSKPWMEAAKLDASQGKPLAPMLVNSIVCELIMAVVIAGLIAGLGPVSFGAGITVAFWVWLGFIATTTAVNQRYEGFGWGLTVIDALHWLGVTLIMGGIIGAWGA